MTFSVIICEELTKMKVVSHSEISTYLDCQKKWELIYVKGLKLDNVHFRFGLVGHKALETRVIPDESLYPELKEEFGISSWHNYFTPIFKEIDNYFADYDLIETEYPVGNEQIRGVVDAIWKNKSTGRILITDYKFSNNDKGQTDILLDEQMYIYAVLYAAEKGLSLEDIDIGYINIPKKEMDSPRVLKSGQLSKDKAQNVSHETFLAKIHELGLNEEDYADVLSELVGRKLISIHTSSINMDMCIRIMENIDNTIKDMRKGYVLEKCTFQCKHCEYLPYCKYGKDFVANKGE